MPHCRTVVRVLSAVVWVVTKPGEALSSLWSRLYRRVLRGKADTEVFIQRKITPAIN